MRVCLFHSHNFNQPEIKICIFVSVKPQKLTVSDTEKRFCQYQSKEWKSYWMNGWVWAEYKLWVQPHTEVPHSLLVWSELTLLQQRCSPHPWVILASLRKLVIRDWKNYHCPLMEGESFTHELHRFSEVISDRHTNTHTKCYCLLMGLSWRVN